VIDIQHAISLVRNRSSGRGVAKARRQLAIADALSAYFAFEDCAPRGQLAHHQRWSTNARIASELPKIWRLVNLRDLVGMLRATIVQLPNDNDVPLMREQYFHQSGRPDSNRRRPAWEAGILPTELRPQSRRETPRRQHAMAQRTDDDEDLAVAGWGVNWATLALPRWITSRTRRPAHYR
jgi:hypothetical protein